MELPEPGGRVSGSIEVWAGDVMANDHLVVQTEIIAKSTYLAFNSRSRRLIATGNPTLPPSLPQFPRSSRFASFDHNCLWFGYVLPGRNRAHVLDLNTRFDRWPYVRGRRLGLQVTTCLNHQFLQALTT